MRREVRSGLRPRRVGCGSRRPVDACARPRVPRRLVPLAGRLIARRRARAIVPGCSRLRPDHGVPATSAAERTCSAPTRRAATCSPASCYGAVHSLSGALVAVARRARRSARCSALLAGSVGGVVDDVAHAHRRRAAVDPRTAAGADASSSCSASARSTSPSRSAIGCVAAFARLSRSEVVRVRRTDYVEAAFGSGGTRARRAARGTCCRTRSAAVIGARRPAVRRWRSSRSRRSASSATAPRRPRPSGGCSSPRAATTSRPPGG